MIVGLAVAAAIGSLKSAGFSSKVMLNQAKASDVWAYYQAKTIKQRLSEMEARTTGGANSQKAQADSLRYREEEKVLQTKAESFEKERDEASKHGAPLGFAIASLQVSIALASVCLITKRKILWAASGILGAVGFGYLLLGLYGV